MTIRYRSHTNADLVYTAERTSFTPKYEPNLEDVLAEEVEYVPVNPKHPDKTVRVDTAISNNSRRVK